MCIIFWTSPQLTSTSTSTSSSPYALVIAANRDEYLSRPASPAKWHSFEPPTLTLNNSRSALGDDTGEGTCICSCLSGRDLGDPAGSGGTWIGINKQGKIGILTNIHDEVPIRLKPKPEYESGEVEGSQHVVKSRGNLIKDWLTITDPEEEKRFLNGLKSSEEDYTGYNLLLFSPPTGTTHDKNNSFDRMKATYITNRCFPSQPFLERNTEEIIYPSTVIRELTIEELTRGGMSNSTLEKPFEKVKKGIESFLCGSNKEVVVEGSAGGVLDETISGKVKSSLSQEKELIKELMDHMGQSKTVSSRSDLYKSISVPLIHMPIPSPAPTPKPPSSQITSTTTKPYGTRLTTLILIKTDGEVLFIERDRLRLIDSSLDDIDGVDVGDGKKVVSGGTEDRIYRFVIGR